MKGALLLAAFLLVEALSACQVPVFRFALERWPADPFRLLVTHRGGLDAPMETAVGELREALAEPPRPINLALDVLDLAELTDRQRLSTPGFEHLPEDPALVLLPPASWKSDGPAWSGSPDPATLALLLDSPARQECIDLLVAGESAVWILVTSGDAEADARARAVLEQGLAKAATLEIPEGVIRRDKLAEHTGDLDLDDVLRSDVPLKISFALLTVAHDAPEEALFLKTLLGPAAPPPGEPLVVPVFGRGRTPGPLPASMLTPQRIFAACQYLCGSCSCRVKQDNPGYDILLRAKWEELLDTTVLTAESELVTKNLDVVTIEPDADLSARPRPGMPFGPLAAITAILALIWISLQLRRSA